MPASAVAKSSMGANTISSSPYEPLVPGCDRLLLAATCCLIHTQFNKCLLCVLLGSGNTEINQTVSYCSGLRGEMG